MNIRLNSLVVFLAFLLTGANVGATSFTSMYSFGDSLSDGGSSPSARLSIYNLIGVLNGTGIGACDSNHPCPPYVDGHYSNGNVAVEYLASSILSGGGAFNNFAVSGATTGVGNFGDGGTATNQGTYSLPGMSWEIAYYLSLSGGTADPNALYFLWGGANDFLTDVYSASTAITAAESAAQNIKDYVTTLATVGARHFLIPNLPDLSLTPFVKTEPVPEYGAWAKTFSNSFNAELEALLGGLNPLLDIVQFDTYSFFNNLKDNPADYGFTNSVDACLSGSVLVVPPGLLTCAEPDKHIYWDGFHPTTRTHALFGTAFASAVPEPAKIVLLAVSLIALSVTGRQRRSLYPHIKT